MLMIMVEKLSLVFVRDILFLFQLKAGIKNLIYFG